MKKTIEIGENKKSIVRSEDRSRMKIQTLPAQGPNSWLMVVISISLPLLSYRQTQTLFICIILTLSSLCIKHIYPYLQAQLFGGEL